MSEAKEPRDEAVTRFVTNYVDNKGNTISEHRAQVLMTREREGFHQVNRRYREHDPEMLIDGIIKLLIAHFKARSKKDATAGKVQAPNAALRGMRVQGMSYDPGSPPPPPSRATWVTFDPYTATGEVNVPNLARRPTEASDEAPGGVAIDPVPGAPGELWGSQSPGGLPRTGCSCGDCERARRNAQGRARELRAARDLAQAAVHDVLRSVMPREVVDEAVSISQVTSSATEDIT